MGLIDKKSREVKEASCVMQKGTIQFSCHFVRPGRLPPPTALAVCLSSRKEVCMNTANRNVWCVAMVCGMIVFGVAVSAQNRAGGLTEVVLMTGSNQSIAVTLTVGTTRPEHPHDWARLLFRKVKEGGITPRQALLAIAFLPASSRSPISGTVYLELKNYLSDPLKQPARAADPDYEEFDLLAGLASLGSAAVPSLREALADDQPSVAKTALSILERIGPLTQNAFARLIPLLESPDPAVRRQAAKSLTNAADAVASPAAVAALRKALRDEEISVRTAVAVALTRLDPASSDGVTAMAADLKSRTNRIAAAYALGEMGERAASTGQPLVDLMISNDTEVRNAAIYALGKIGAPIVSQVVILLDAKDEQHRMAASAVLLAVGKPAVRAVMDRLSKIRDSKDIAFAPVMGIVIGLGEQAVPTLIENLKYRDEPRAIWSAFALGQIGPPAMPAVSALTTAARSTNIALRREATEALKKIQVR